jgi:hypothetical protein
VERDAVVAGGVVVDEAKVVGGVGGRGGDVLQEGEALWDGPGPAGVFVGGDGLGGAGVDEGSGSGEEGGVVDSEDGREAWGVDYGFFTIAIDAVGYTKPRVSLGSLRSSVVRDIGHVWKSAFVDHWAQTDSRVEMLEETRSSRQISTLV